MAVDLGPGLFTGLRVGVAAAKGLAQALGIGVVGLSSLDILPRAAAQCGHRGRVLAAVDARRGEVFASCGRCARMRTTGQGEPDVVALGSSPRRPGRRAAASWGWPGHGRGRRGAALRRRSRGRARRVGASEHALAFPPPSTSCSVAAGLARRGVAPSTPAMSSPCTCARRTPRATSPGHGR